MRKMKITHIKLNCINIGIIGLALFIQKYKLLIVSDFHLGYEDYLKEKGVFVPRNNLNSVLKQMAKILKTVKPKVIVINGDLKHEFGRISRQEWNECFELASFLKRKCKNLVLIKGNHYKIIEPIAKKFDVTIAHAVRLGNILIVHGHKIEQLKLKGIKILITAHEHPAFEISDGLKKEKYKAYYIGSYKNRKIIMQPSFNMLCIGSKPRLDFDVERVYAIGDGVYEFRES